MAAARREREQTDSAALVAEIFGGRSAQRLPATVVEALERLQRARSAEAA